MKRMISCEKCMKIPLKHFDGEWHKRVEGTAKKDMFCDYCYPEKKIRKGDPCAAESMGIEGQPYYEWEPEYIQVREDGGE